MNDLEITKLCAEAMGLKTSGVHSLSYVIDSTVTTAYGDIDFTDHWRTYDPLHDDAQAMALVKRFHIQIWPEVKRSLKEHIYTGWTTFIFGTGTATSTNLNRAICECVAKMQKGRV